MTLIPITGIPDNFRVPGAYAEILMGQGPGSAAANEREVVLAMPMLASGTWTAGKLYRIRSEKDAQTGGGVGSPIHRGARKFLACNRKTTLWGLPVGESTGVGLVAADFDVTWVGDPTARGATTVRVCGEDCTYCFSSTDTVTTIAAGVAAIINAKSHLPVTAANLAGVLTITAKLSGISQGTGAVDVLRVWTSIDPGCTTTISASGAVGDTTAGVDGATTTEAANLATALATLNARRIYYIVSSANEATSYGNLALHILNKSQPDPGLRSVGIVAYTGALAGCQALAIARNYERLAIAWQEASDHDCAELAAQLAAVRSLHEATDPTYNFAGYSQPNWTILPAYLEADWPTSTDLIDAINTQWLGDAYDARLIAHEEQTETRQAMQLEQAGTLTALVGQPVMTVNEGRAWLGLEPFPDENTLVDDDDDGGADPAGRPHRPSARRRADLPRPRFFARLGLRG
jgi:phage tail sheath gpL-like